MDMNQYMINEMIINELDEEFLNADINHLRDEWDHYEYEGLPVPRVTKIIHSCQLDAHDALIKWANRMGFCRKDATEERDYAASLGSRVHELIDEYINHNISPNFAIQDDVFKYHFRLQTAFNNFKAFWDNYRYKNLIESVSTEKTLVTPYFGGTYDLLITLKDGRKYLYDFKTTNTLRDSHFVQLAAYNYALRNYYNTQLSGVAILKISKSKSGGCYEYMIDFDENPGNKIFIDHCERTFISMLYAYYNMTVTKLEFDQADFIKKEK